MPEIDVVAMARPDGAGFIVRSTPRHGTQIMKSALCTIALGSKAKASAIVATLERAQAQLEASGHAVPAAYIDMAITTLLIDTAPMATQAPERPRSSLARPINVRLPT